MQYFNGNLSREINRLRGRSGTFWAAPYHASMALDEAAVLERVKYIFQNSVKEGLVKHPRYWPGVHCYRHLCENRALRGIWVKRSAPQMNQHNGASRAHESNVEHLVLNLDRLPFKDDGGAHGYAQSMRELARTALSQIEQPASFLGQKKVLAVDPFSAPKKTSKRPAPFCHSSCPNLRRIFCDAYKAFVALYREAAAAVHGGLNAHFPPGGIVHLSWSQHTTVPD